MRKIAQKRPGSVAHSGLLLLTSKLHGLFNFSNFQKQQAVAAGDLRDARVHGLGLSHRPRKLGYRTVGRIFGILLRKLLHPLPDLRHEKSGIGSFKTSSGAP